MTSAAMSPRDRVTWQADRNRLLGDPARLQIVEAIATEPRLISELTALTGLHRNTVREHLGRLIDAGLIAAEPSAPAGPGRPAVRYRLRDRLGLPGAEQTLLINSLLRLVAGAYRAEASAEAEQEGYLLGRQLAAAGKPDTVDAALAQVIAILRDLAFAPELESGDEVKRIALHRCPFAVSPDDQRGTIICAFHLGLIRGVMDVADAGSHRVRLLPHAGPDFCRAEISFAEAG